MATTAVTSEVVTSEWIVLPPQRTEVREATTQRRMGRPIMKWYKADGKLACKWVPDTL